MKGFQSCCLAFLLLHRTEPTAAAAAAAAVLWMTPVALLNSALLLKTTEAAADAPFRKLPEAAGVFSSQTITPRERRTLLDFHNRVRSQVLPPAANMELMVWDEGLAALAFSWASQCLWDHGPRQVIKYLGQNLSITSGRYKSIVEPLQSWHSERRGFSYPDRCSGSVCSHYTQMVWASSSRVGCAVRKCSNMHVFGKTWKEATLLVCNYSVKGNWVGEAPYKTGKPCSVCPSSYGGSCWRNQCSANSKLQPL